MTANQFDKARNEYVEALAKFVVDKLSNPDLPKPNLQDFLKQPEKSPYSTATGEKEEKKVTLEDYLKALGESTLSDIEDFSEIDEVWDLVSELKEEILHLKSRVLSLENLNNSQPKVVYVNQCYPTRIPPNPPVVIAPFYPYSTTL
jgi:hypothetical protein